MATPPTVDPPPWGFIEWSISTLAAVVLAISGFIMRTNVNIHNHEVRLDIQKDNLERVVEDVQDIKDKLAVRPTNQDIGTLISSLQKHLEERLDQVTRRLDRIDERIDSILTRK